jgi:hypothetical protein
MIDVNTALLQRLAPVLRADDGDKYLDGPVTVHACIAGTFAQFWIAYPGDPDHTGIDWEMVMFSVGTGGEPLQAAYARHRTVTVRPWTQVRKVDGHPVVLVSRHKHASYFDGMWHRHGRHLERTNARRELAYTLVLDVPAAVAKRPAHMDPDAWVLRRLQKRSVFRRASARLVG